MGAKFVYSIESKLRLMKTTVYQYFTEKFFGKDLKKMFLIRKAFRVPLELSILEAFQLGCLLQTLLSYEVEYSNTGVSEKDIEASISHLEYQLKKF